MRPSHPLLSIALLAGVLGAGPPAAAATRFLAFGDSITVGLGDTGVDCFAPPTFAGYPPRLRSLLQGFGKPTVFVHAAICGEETPVGLSRIDTVLPLAAGEAVILLMEGTNDISRGISLETIRFNLAEMAKKARALRVEPVHFSVIPRGPEAGRDATNAMTGALATLLAGDAAAAGALFGDPFDALIGVPDLFELYYSDTYHPNPEGYDLMVTPMVAPALAAIERLAAPSSGPCVADASHLCLNQGRFEIEVDWFNQLGNTGIGKAVALTGDTGDFWFNNPDNVELVIKVLDGRPNNGHFWVFYGALSNVEYTIRVRDTETETTKTYFNPLGAFASVGDTHAFAAPAAAGGAGFNRAPAPALSTTVQAGAGCATTSSALCLQSARFRLEVSWRDQLGRSGIGTAVPLSPDTGYFWFFRDTNVELIVKVLDGRNNNGHFWVFYGALSNVEYTMTVTDTKTGAQRTYFNPLGSFASVGDTQAFPGSP